MDKTYVTTIDFSQDSDTWDLEYRKTYMQFEYTSEGLSSHGERKSAPTYDQLQDKLTHILGTHLIPLTPFSAKKVE